MHQVRLLLRALKWRASATVAVLVVATASVLAASAGPFYYTAVSGNVLHGALVNATPSNDSITDIPSPALGDIPGRSQVLIPLARRYRLGRWYAPPIVTLDAGVTVPPDAEGHSYVSDLVSRTDVCAHLTFLTGRCPTAVDQVAMTLRSAEVMKAQVGSQISLLSHGIPTPTTVTVVGIVKVGTAKAPYWLGDDYFDYAGLPKTASAITQFLNRKAPSFLSQLPVLDAFFTVPATVNALPLSSLVQFRLRVKTIGVNNVPQLLKAGRAFAYTSNTRYIDPAATQLYSELSAVTYQDDLMLAVVVVVSLELVLLTLFVLFGMVARTVEARQREISLAKLHGFRRRSVLAVGLLEPLVILLASIPIGVLLGWLAIRLASAMLLSNAPVLFTPLAIYAALAAFGGGLLATVFGAWRILRRPLSDELTGSEAQLSSAARAALEAMVVLLAIGALVELRVSGVLSGVAPNPLALFAPALIAVAIGVLGVRLIPLLCAAGIRWTQDTTRLAVHLAVRQVARRPGNLRQILVLTLATGLASFAVVGWAVASTNRISRAEFEIGAATVLHVKVPPSLDLTNAVRKADPSGKYAMAVEESITPSEALLAVDTSRMGRVSYWQRSVSGTSLPKLVRWLQPKLTPEMIMQGHQARVTVTLPQAVDPEPDLQFNLVDPGGNPTLVDFGVLQPGTHTYVASLPYNCSGGCRVSEMVPYWGANPGGPQHVTYTMVLSALQTRANAQARWRNAFGGFSLAGYWQTAFSGASATASPDGKLVTQFHASASELLVPALTPGKLPLTLPGVTTSADQESNPVYASAEDFDGTYLTLNLTRETLALPRLGQYGFLLNLPVATRAENGPPFDTADQVWLAPHTPEIVLHRLRQEGIKIKSKQTPGPLLYRFNHGGLAFGFIFFLFAAAAAALLAAGSGVATVLTSARGRGFELAVLRATGVRRRTLLFSLVLEQQLVVVPGIALGLLAGVLSAVLALSSVPQFGSNVGAPPPSTALPWLPILGTAVVLLILVATTSTATALVALRRSRYQTLRSETS